MKVNREVEKAKALAYRSLGLAKNKVALIYLSPEGAFSPFEAYDFIFKLNDEPASNKLNGIRIYLK